MTNEGQMQKAGNGATQTQIENLTIVNNGITEQRAREICNELLPQILQEYTDEATNTARSRINQFENELLNRVKRVEEMLPAFADPTFQFALKNAQRTAASTEREDDYSLLSELLVCHVQKGDGRKNRAGIGRAISIVGEIDNDALCALTVAHAIMQFVPITGNTLEGLHVLNELFNKLLYHELPSGTEWLDHLDVLGAIRLNSFITMKQIFDFYSSTLDGYICVGIEKYSEEYRKAIDILNAAHINSSFLIPNDCLDNYVRLAICQYNSIDNLLFNKGAEKVPLSEDHKQAVRQVWNMYSKDSKLMDQVNTKFKEMWNSFDSLSKIGTWWDSLPRGFSITQVGRVLAQTNAKRCDPSIPDLI